MTRATIVVLSVTAIGALAISRPFWFSGIDDQLRRSKEVRYSQEIDLGRLGRTSWSVPYEDWPYLGDIVPIYLVLERTSEMTGSDYYKRAFPLRVRIDVDAEVRGVMSTDRLIATYFNQSALPTEERPKIWAGWSDDRTEYLLGYASFFPYETLHLQLHVLTADPVLALARARLMLRANYDSAVPGHALGLFVLRDTVILAGCIAVLLLARAAWRRQGPELSPATAANQPLQRTEGSADASALGR